GPRGAWGGGTGEGLPITRSAAVGKQVTQLSLIRYRRDVPRSSARTNPTAASCRRCSDTVDWPTGTAATISLTVSGRALRASRDTICTLVLSASALNHAAYVSAVWRSSGSASFIVYRR